MQWRPLLPKEGGLIQVDIGGHPPFLVGSKQLSSNFDNLLFLAVFRVLNFRSHLEALNDVFWGMLRLQNFIMKFCANVVVLRWIFPMAYHTLKMRIVWKIYNSKKLMYWLTQMGPTWLLALHLLELGFWMSSVFDIPAYCKKALRSSL